MSFLAFVDGTLLLAAGTLMAVCFLLWELPRSLRLLDWENEKIVYSASNRVFDILVFALGLLLFIFCLASQNAVINAVRMPTFSIAFSILYLAAPALIFFGFLGKAVKMLEEHRSLSLFSMCFLLNLFRTVFYMSFSLVSISVAVFLFTDFYY